jgi:hypothetical protein
MEFTNYSEVNYYYSVETSLFINKLFYVNYLIIIYILKGEYD